MYHMFYSIPLVVGLFYAIGGMTNSYLFHRFPSILYAIHLGLGLGAMYLKEFSVVPQQTQKTLETQL